MAEAMTGAIDIECGECGTKVILSSPVGRSGFLEMGWRFGDVSASEMMFRCAHCCAAERDADSLAVRKTYLAHIFEAQSRFGE